MKKNLLPFKKAVFTADPYDDSCLTNYRSQQGKMVWHLLKQLLYIFTALLLIQGAALGQTTLAKFQFNNTWDPDPGAIGSPVITRNYDLSFTSTNGNPSPSVVAASNDVWLMLEMSTIGYKSITIKWDGANFMNYSPDNTQQWLLIVSPGYDWSTIYTQDLTNSWITIPAQTLGAEFNNNPKIQIQIKSKLVAATYFPWAYIDNLIVTGTPIPTLSVEPASLDFGEVCNTTTAGPGSFTITGANLTNENVTIGPLANYTFCTVADGTYTSSLSLAQTGGSYSQDIYVKFTPVSEENYDGNIPVTGGGSTLKNVVVSGSGKGVPSTTANPNPANGASDVSYSDSVSSVSWDPVTDATSYDIYFGAGSLPASFTTVNTNSYSTGALSAGTTYHWKVVPKNECGATTGTPVEWTFTTVTPTITVSSASLNYGEVCVNSISPEQSYTVSGSDLTAAIEITPPAGFEISRTSGTGFSSTAITLTQSSGNVAATPIYVRFSPTSSGTASGNITHTNTEAATVNVAVSGIGKNHPLTATNPSPANGATDVCYAGPGTVSSVTWNAVSGATSYDVYFGAGSLPVSPTATGIGTNSWSTGALSESTTYHWKVVPRNGCGETTETPAEWTFTTDDFLCYCNPSSNSNSTYINTFSAIGSGTSKISNSGTGYTSPGFADYSSNQSVSQYANNHISWSITFVTPGGVRPAGFSLWVDWDKNGFGPGDNVYITSSAQLPGTYTGSFLVPSGTIPGNYRMRVFVDAVDGSPDDPCNFAYYYYYGNVYLGEAEDYTVTVTEGSCIPPVPTFTAYPTSPQCTDAPVTYTTQAGKTNYIWSIAGTEHTDYEISSGGTSTDQSVTLTWLTAGTKTVTVNYVEVCMGTVPASSTITVNQQPVADAGEDAVACGLTTVLNATSSIGTGTWTKECGTGNASFDVNINEPDATVTVDEYDTYVFRWTEVNSNCSNYDEVTVTFYPQPEPTFVESPASPQFAGDAVTYTTQAGKTNYIWNISGTEHIDYEIVSGGTSLDNTVTLTWLAGGSKTVSVNYTEGCQGITPASSTITVVTYCIPSSNTAETYINDFSATGSGTINISNGGTGYTAGGFADYSSSQSVSQSENNPVNWSITFATPSGGGTTRPAGFSIWVDWDKDGFDSGDNVYITGSSQSPGTYTGSFSVPTGQIPGNYRMRVLVDAVDGTPNDPCNFAYYYYYGNHYLGEAEDYTVNVTESITPTIFVSAAAFDFGEVCVNASSAEQSYTVSGSDLSADIIITPPEGFELSKTPGTGFAGAPVTLTQTGGSIESTPVYVRFSPTGAGTASGNIIHTSMGVTAENVDARGKGITAPVADFTGSPNILEAGGSVNFADNSSNTPTSWLWSFPGGSPSSSTDQHPLVTYAAAGIYSVTFTATNDCGSDDETKSDYITVNETINAQIFTTPGDHTFKVPDGVTTVTVKVWGGGGGGSFKYPVDESDPDNIIFAPGAGGGGGGFCGGTISVIPGEYLDIIVGNGGYDGNSIDIYGSNGEESEVRDASGTWWITAFGGSGGNGAEAGTGSGGNFYPTVLDFTIHYGGDGSAGIQPEEGFEYGGGAGGGAGDSQDGSDAVGEIGGTGGNNSGGKGGDFGSDGTAFSGGGGGANNEEYPSAGMGANGGVIIQWVPVACANATIALSSAAGTDNQTVVAGSAITNIVYTTGGEATEAFISPEVPIGMSAFYDADLKTFTISGTPTVAGTYEYTISTSGATSPCTNEKASGTITINPFQDVIPPVAICQNLSVYLDESGIGTITAQQVDNGSNDESGIKSLVLSQTDFYCNNIGDNLVILTVTDNSNNVTTCEATVTVIDDLPPVVNANPGEVTVNCASLIVYIPESPTATDNCGTEPIIGEYLDYVDYPSPLTCEGNRVYTFRYTDQSGNSTDWTYTYHVVINDFTLPADGASTVECALFATAEGITPPKANSSDCIWKGAYSIEPTGPLTNKAGTDTYNGCEGTISYTWTYTDCTGRYSHDWTYTYTIEVPEFADITATEETVECYADFNPANFELPTLYDYCGNLITDIKGPNEDIQLKSAISDICAADVNYTWIYTDCAGNSKNYVHMVHIVKSDFLVNMPPDKGETIACKASLYEPVPPAVYDNCGTEIIPVGPFVITIPGCEGQVIYTWNYTDCTRKYSHDWTYTFTITDEIFPEVVCQNKTVDLDVNGAASIVLDDVLLSADDNCAGGLTVDFAPKTFDCSDVGSNSVVVTASDCAGNIATCEAVVTVRDITPPTFTSPDDITVYRDANCQYDATPAVTGDVTDEWDNCNIGHAVYYDFSEPVPDQQCFKVIERTWSLVDNAGNRAENQVQIITIRDSIPPVILQAENELNREVECSDPRNLDRVLEYVVPTATDNCAGIEELRPGLRSDIQTADPDCPNAYYRTRTWYFTDGCGNSSTDYVQVIHVVDNESPVLKDPLVTSSSLDEFRPQCLSFAQLFDAGTLEADVANLYKDCGAVNANLDNALTSITGTDCNWTAVYTYIVTDECGNSTTCQVTYKGGDNTEPYWTLPMPENVSVECNKIPEVPVIEARDNCDDIVAVNFSERSEFSGGCPDNYTIIRTWIATDNCGRSIDHDQYITVTDKTPPVLVNADLDCTSLNSSGNNWCLSEVHAYSASLLESSLAALYEDNCGEVIANWIPDATDIQGTDCNWTAVYTFNVKDECDNGFNCMITYTGGDIEAPHLADPLITSASLNSMDNNWCLEVAEAFDGKILLNNVKALYTDNCESVSAIYTGKTAGTGNSDCAWSFTYHFTVSDGCEHSVNCDVVYSGGDTEAPVAVCQDILVELDQNGMAVIANDSVNNGSSDNCTSSLNFATDVTSFNCSNVGTYLVELTVTDNCGKSSACQAIVTIEDNIAPALTCPDNSPSTRSTDLNRTFYTVAGTEFDASATDACGIQSISYSCATASVPSGSSLAGVQLPEGNHSITWTAEDVNGNQATGQISVTVQKRPVMLTYTGDSEEQYSDETKLLALLVDETHTPVSGKTILFTIGNQSVTGITNDSGEAMANLTLNQSPVPAYTVKTEFEGDATSQPAMDEDLFDINQEDAIPEYTGQEFVGEQNPYVSITPLILSASVTDMNDGYRGDIRNARVQFYDVNTLEPLSGWLTPGLVIPGDLTRGLVNYTWNAPVPITGYNTYTLGVKTGTQNPEDNGYYAGNDKTVVNVFRTDLYEFISGGGHIIPDDSKGEYASDPGRKVNFGFNVKWNKTMKKLQGNLSLVFRIGTETYQIKTNAMNSLSINSINPCSQTAYFTSKANLTRVTLPEFPAEIKGNLDIQVNMTNNTSPGAVSTISFTVYDGNSLCYSSSWPLNQTEELPLAGGNLIVHNGIKCIVNNEVEVMLYSSRNPSLVGEEVIFEAVVTPKGGSIVPEGTIKFMDGSNQMALADMINGKAIFVVSELKEGIHHITAEYVPANDFESAISNEIVQEVLGPVLTIDSDKNPSEEGEAVIFTTTLTVPSGGAPATGTISFYKDTELLGIQVLAGETASIQINNMVAGSHTIAAEYSGDENYKALSASMTQFVNSSVSIGLTSSRNPEQVNNTVIFTATVTGSGMAVVNAEVSFYLNGELIKQVSTDLNGMASTNKIFPVTGTYLIEARLGGQSASLSQVIKNKVKSAEIATGPDFKVKTSSLKVYPNPFDDRLKFEFSSPVPVHARIEIYDMTGRMIETVFDQPIEGEVMYNAEFKPFTLVSAKYIYRVSLGKVNYIDKALYKNRE